MKRLNKCITLGDFTPELAQQSTQSENKEEKKEEKEQPSKENENKEVIEDNKKEAKEDENKSVEEAKPNAEKEEPAKAQDSSSDYLYFGADEFLITTYQFPNGWWYGYKDTTDLSKAKFGYFPSNFVQVIEEYHDDGNEGWSLKGGIVEYILKIFGRIWYNKGREILVIE